VAPLDKNPVYVAAFLAVLAAPQVLGLVTQFIDGFRPFAQAPTRVPFSWDMFAVPITRCTIDWSPEILIGDETVRHLHDRGKALEWDPVFDRATDYASVARAGCRHAPGTRIVLTCFYEDGPDTTDEMQCR
jgi:hypothetical protein